MADSNEETRAQEAGAESIRVAVRLRPLLTHEKGQAPCFTVTDENEIAVIRNAVNPGDTTKESRWRFDHAMDSSDPSKPTYVSNIKCYELMAENIVKQALQGFNACLFCYGQTGTGKTTTIMGDEEHGDGIVILLLRDLFAHVDQKEDVRITLSILEVYNEKLYDLLAKKTVEGDTTRNHVELHVIPGGVQIRNATTKNVNSMKEGKKLIDQSAHMKHMASTYMNAQSSRGHTVYKLGIESHDGDGVHVTSDIYIVDLAGHENEKLTRVTGDHLTELSFINKSLMWLQHAIHGLSQQHSDSHHKHIPSATSQQVNHLAKFRNSKLTLLLSNALTGNSRVSVIATVSPAALHFPTSVSTLRFANEVKRIKTEVHSTVFDDPRAALVSLEKEVKRLREQLAAGSTNDCAPSSDGRLAIENSKLRSEISKLREQMQAALGGADLGVVGTTASRQIDLGLAVITDGGTSAAPTVLPRRRCLAAGACATANGYSSNNCSGSRASFGTSASPCVPLSPFMESISSATARVPQLWKPGQQIIGQGLQPMVCSSSRTTIRRAPSPRSPLLSPVTSPRTSVRDGAFTPPPLSPFNDKPFQELSSIARRAQQRLIDRLPVRPT
jgi:hypothetical protein